VLRADLVQCDEIAGLIGRRAFAFAGIAHPQKFFSGLERAGVLVVGRMAFADHHAFTDRELAGLETKAQAVGAVLVTTPKDSVRLPAGMAIQVVGVRLVWESEAAIETLLDEALAGTQPHAPPGLAASMA
jgi:tetraacyldisaccharide 4'-kinase